MWRGVSGENMHNNNYIESFTLFRSNSLMKNITNFMCSNYWMEIPILLYSAFLLYFFRLTHFSTPISRYQFKRGFLYVEPSLLQLSNLLFCRMNCYQWLNHVYENFSEWNTRIKITNIITNNSSKNAFPNQYWNALIAII